MVQDNSKSERSLEIPLPSPPRSPLCPVKTFTNMCQLVSTKHFYPAFALSAFWAFHSNVPVDHIHVQGDWRSDAYKKYLDFEFSYRGWVSGAMGIALKHSFFAQFNFVYLV